MSSAEDAIVQFVKTGKFEFSSLVDSILEDIIRMQVRQNVTGPLAKALGGFDFGSLFGGGEGGSGGSDGGWIFGGGGTSTGGHWSIVPTAPTFHRGGIVGVTGAPGRAVDPALFAGAPRFHDGGLVPGEVPIIARAGEEVLTEDNPRHRNNAGGQEIVLRIIDGEGREVPNRQSRGSNGQLNVEMMIDQMVGRLGRRRGTETRRMIEDLGGGAGLRSV